MSDKKSKLVIVDELLDDNRTLAYRNKPSIDIYPMTKEIGFSEFSYTYEEIIAIGKKLEEFLKKDVVDVT